jgi:lipoprotein-anchoring transpeptidase ErfK/SrfK
MVPRLPGSLIAVIILLIVASRQAAAMPVLDQADASIDYRMEKLTEGSRDLTSRFGGPEIALLEKLNRADAKHLPRLTQLVVPSAWRSELEHSPFPSTYTAASATPKLLIVDQPSQAFAAYEYGQQVHWGPVSSGRQAKPTPSGVYHLNWRARSRTSTLSGEWRLNWYFNFHNTRGLAFHEFDLPGVPQSHACVRLLARDAEWVYKWGESWTLDVRGQLSTPGTAVLIMGNYAFGSPAPWQAADYWTRKIALPEVLPAR